MRKFHFSLTTVLKVRQQAEKRTKQEYLDQKKSLQFEMQHLETLLTALSQCESEARPADNEFLDLVLARAQRNYLALLEKKILKTRERIRWLEEDLTRLQIAWMEAQKAVKVLERLKERKYADYRKNAQQQEQKFIDDISSIRHQATQQR
jgi:flagellar FliJ protein